MADKSKGIEFTKIQSEQIRKDAKRVFWAIMVLSVFVASITFIEGNGFGTVLLRILASIPAMLAFGTLDFYERAFEGKFRKGILFLKLLISMYIGFIVVQIPALITGLNW